MAYDEKMEPKLQRMSLQADSIDAVEDLIKALWWSETSGWVNLAPKPYQRAVELLRETPYVRRAEVTRDFVNQLVDLSSSRIPAPLKPLLLQQTPYLKRMKPDATALTELLTDFANERPNDAEHLASLIKRRFQVFADGSKDLFSDKRYDREAGTGRVLNQRKMKVCWLLAECTRISDHLSAELKEPVQISTEYLYLRDIYARVMFWAHQGLRGFKSWNLYTPLGSICEGNGTGGSPPRARVLAREYGLVTETAWKAKANPFDHRVNRRFIVSIEKILREVSHRIECVEDREARDGQSYSEDKSALYKELNDRIKGLIVDSFGDLPEPDQTILTVGLRSFTPKSLYAYAVQSGGMQHHCLAPTTDVPLRLSGILYTSTPNCKKNRINWNWDLFVASAESLEGVIRETIDGGKTIVLSHEAPLPHVNKMTGMMIFDSVTPDPCGEKSESHDAVVTGYELDFYGRIAGLKIQNSWGSKVGTRGIFYMSSSFLWKWFIALSP